LSLLDINYDTHHKTPENHNIYISNLKSKNVMVYKNGKWMVAERKSQITDIYDDKHFVLEEWYEYIAYLCCPF
jgi:hypothetical protein